MRSRLLLYLGAMSVALTVSAQNKPVGPPRSPWTVLVDPVCPVSSFYGVHLPNASREMHVLYFPYGDGAKLKNPKSPLLQIVFNAPRQKNSEAIPFNRKDDHWEATVPLAVRHAMYAIFNVTDKTGSVDDNSGKYWDVVFCGPTGEKDPNGLIAQADGYKGEPWPFGIHREKDLNKAIALLEKMPETKGFTLFSSPAKSGN